MKTVSGTKEGASRVRVTEIAPLIKCKGEIESESYFCMALLMIYSENMPPQDFFKTVKTHQSTKYPGQKENQVKKNTLSDRRR